MKNLAKLILSILFCELVGIAATPFTIPAISSWYKTLHKPSFSPPNWVFGPVWTVLYFLMGVSFFLIWNRKMRTKKERSALLFFFVQLLLNFLWSFLFFGLHSPLLSLIDIILMVIFIGITMKDFFQISKPAFLLFIPYLLWVSFATMLNAAILFLNSF